MTDESLIKDEHWKPVPGFEEYQVSDHGRIKKKNGKLKKTVIQKNGYERVSFYENGKAKAFLVHRLVAEAFLVDDTDNLSKDHHVVMHLNDDRTDNRASNLKFGSKKENYLDSERKGRAKNNRVPVQCIETGKTFDSINSAVKHYGLNMWSFFKKPDKPSETIKAGGYTFIRLENKSLQEAA